MTAAGAVRIAQVALLAAAAATGVAYLDFGWFEVAVAIVGGSVLAASAELALDRPPPARREPVRWNLTALERAARRVDRDTFRHDQLAHLLHKLEPFADELGYLPPDLDDLVRESLPELLD